MPRMRSFLEPIFALALFAPLISAQGITTLVMDGDAVPGVGNVIAIQGIAVSDAGDVFVHVLTDNPVRGENAAFIDGNGAVVIRESDPLAEPPGSVISSFIGGVIDVNGAGTAAYKLFVDPGSESGIYVGANPDLVVLESTAVTASRFPAGTTWSVVLSPQINSSLDTCFHAAVNTPGGSNLETLIRVDGTTGIQTALYTEGDLLPGQTDPIEDFQWDVHGLAFNDAGQVLFGAETTGPSSQSHVYYLDDVKLAQSGDPSPFGTTYSLIAGSTHGVDLNNAGEYVFACQLNSFPQGAIVRDGAPFIRGGATFPAIEPFRISELGQPLFIGDNGRVAWYGVWETPAPFQSKGLFIDYSLIVEEGVTEIGGLLVEMLPATDRAFVLSGNGRYLVFEAVLEGNLDGAFLVDLGS